MKMERNDFVKEAWKFPLPVSSKRFYPFLNLKCFIEGVGKRKTMSGEMRVAEVPFPPFGMLSSPQLKKKRFKRYHHKPLNRKIILQYIKR